jgi:hypothetical protein
MLELASRQGKLEELVVDSADRCSHSGYRLVVVEPAVTGAQARVGA